MTDNEDLYDILGVKDSATPCEIRRAYHKLAKKYHPDKHPANPVEATISFQKIKSAYTTLSDTNKRDFYDISCSADNQSGPESYRNVFSSIYDLMKNIQKESKEKDNKLFDLVLSMKNKSCRTVVKEDSCSSSYDEEKAFEWLYEEENF